jgi:probable DNA metabolism protein
MNEVTYIYDGTLEGLLTVIHDSIYYGKVPGNIKSQNKEEAQTELFGKNITIDTDSTKVVKMRSVIMNTMPIDSMRMILYAFLSETQGVEMTIHNYIVMGLQTGKKTNMHITTDCVAEVDRLFNTVCREGHRMLGFIRFEKVKGAKEEFFYAKIKPDFNVLPVITSHFVNRLPDEKWVIYDESRGLAVFYNKKRCVIREIEDVNIDSMLEEEKQYRDMWREYFVVMGIEERNNKKLQKALVPLKYRENMLEFSGSKKSINSHF